MNKQNGTLTLFAVALTLIGVTALGLGHLKTHQRLGKPGIKASPIPNSTRWDVYLPSEVLDYDSVLVPTDTNVLNGLPHDTSFMARRYTSTSRDQRILMNVVLMGSDRTSIHKPQFCLTGSGWNIDGGESTNDTVRVNSPHPYDLPVMKLISTREEKIDGQVLTARGIYVYWFVADNDLTSSHVVRMIHMTTHLMHTGELQRWAYVSCFAVCAPGQEEANYQRIKEFIAASAPKFQLVAGPQVATAATPQTAAR